MSSDRNAAIILTLQAQQAISSLGDLTAGFLTVQTAEKGLQFVKTGAAALDAARSFDHLATSAHTTGDALLTSLRAAADGTINDVDLMKEANLALLQTQGRVAKDLPQLLTIARASALATGQDVETAFEKIVSGVDKGRAAALAGTGIIIDQKQAYAAYAQSIGIAVSHLTKEEQQQAITNAVLKQGADLVKTVGLNSDDASVKIQKAVTAAENLATALAAKVAPTAGTVAGGLANLLNTGSVTPDTKAAGDQTQGNLIKNAASFEAYAQSIRAANDQISAAFAGDPIGGALARQLHGLEQLNPVQFAYAQSLEATGVAYADAVAQAKALGNVSDSLTQQTQGQSTAFQGLIPKMAAVSASSTDNASNVLALNSAYLQGQVSIDQVRTVLDALISAQDKAQQAAFQEERENRNLARSFDDVVPAAQAAAHAIDGLLAKPLPHLTDKGIVGSGIAGTLASQLTDPHNLAAGNQGVEQLDQVLFDNRLKRATTNAEKIALLRQREAQVSDPVDRARIEGQILDIENQKGAHRVSAAQSTALQLQNVEENSGLQLLRIQRENNERLRDEQEDYDLKRSRSKEDESLKIESLLAHGQRAEADRERQHFALEQKRAAEDETVKVGRTLRNNAEAVGDLGNRTDLRTQQIGNRAALRGVSAGSLPGATATGGGATPPSTAGNAQPILLTVNLDSTAVGTALWKAYLEQKIDGELAISITNSGTPGSGQRAVRGSG
jgi:hypothetical protein